ncbi:hypothetical protein CBM2588_A180228 [Cupriavidus taiwanensis]|nr:hypothetical protein CBM2588_A180228 [Cupriavidus taiwanensis]SOZ79772.1 hypothetical protein CBM2618_A230085 [Cupriavidus taiwanensis]SOZ80421.1 hypothetical protein CBM2622_A210229 [Cupriavidus taiwanensis]
MTRCFRRRTGRRCGPEPLKHS